MKIALIGYGKMGQMIEEIATQRGHQVVLKINIDNTEDFTETNTKAADVAIEFTAPESAFENVKQVPHLWCTCGKRLLPAGMTICLPPESLPSKKNQHFYMPATSVSASIFSSR
jgi:6-phosphogluconate dehydrogenase (decarboxylating)